MPLLQEIKKDMSCFNVTVTASEYPLYSLCEVLLTVVESSLDNIRRAKSFTLPLTLLIPYCETKEQVQQLV